MLDYSRAPAVACDELLARFVLFSSHIRKGEHSVKPDAFMPHPRVETSLTRHVEATTHELWQEGLRVASIRGTHLHGRADVSALAFAAESLAVVARPLQENPNHADAIGWPPDKAAQKMIATEIARKSKLVYR